MKRNKHCMVEICWQQSAKKKIILDKQVKKKFKEPHVRMYEIVARYSFAHIHRMYD